MLFKGTIENPDAAMLKRIRKRIKQHNGFCPNKTVRNADTKCPCRDYREYGSCDCGLYIKDITSLIDQMFDSHE